MVRGSVNFFRMASALSAGPASASSSLADASLAGKVLDKSTLRSIFAAMTGFLGTAIPLILALKQETTTRVAGDTQCDISAQNIAVIQSELMGRNETCLYNVSLGAVLDMYI